MRKAIVIFSIVIAVLCVPTFATVGRSFVSRAGVDTNPCTVDLPCRSFGAAISVTNPKGEVVANDSAGYGTVSVTQSVSIIAPLGVHAGVSVFAGDGITVNAASADVVVLRNLYINSQGGVNGVSLTSARVLHIEHCVISGFSSNDINLVPTVKSDVSISDTMLRRAAGAGIYADSAQPLTVAIVGSHLEFNTTGVLADRAAVAVRNSTADGHSNAAFYARGTGGQAIVAIESTTMTGNNVAVSAAPAGVAEAHNSTALKNNTAYFADSGKLTVDHCTGSGGLWGVYDSTGNVTVIASTFADNSVDGVRVTASGTCRLSRNTITRNAGYGINVVSGTAFSPADNMVDGNGLGESSGTITPLTKM